MTDRQGSAVRSPDPHAAVPVPAGETMDVAASGAAPTASPPVPLFRRALALATGSAGARLLGMGTFIVLARALGVERFGVFTYAMSLALTIGVLIDLGQTAHIGRVVAVGGERGTRAFGHLAANKAVLTVVAVAAVTTVARLAGVARPRRPSSSGR